MERVGRSTHEVGRRDIEHVREISKNLIIYIKIISLDIVLISVCVHRHTDKDTQTHTHTP